MIGKGRKKGTIRFAFMPNGEARRVQIVGDFTGWKPMTMRKRSNGSYVVVLPLDSGAHEYKFLVDGQWHADPDNHCWAPNVHGTMNSIAMVE